MGGTVLRVDARGVPPSWWTGRAGATDSARAGSTGSTRGITCAILARVG
ncbi:hypothetical protein YT1_4610 [Rhodococcus ruber]|nr:hypothetical protein YT1_4610 [Rhodococcus ruber]